MKKTILFFISLFLLASSVLAFDTLNATGANIVLLIDGNCSFDNFTIEANNITFGNFNRSSCVIYNTKILKVSKSKTNLIEDIIFNTPGYRYVMANSYCGDSVCELNESASNCDDCLGGPGGGNTGSGGSGGGSGTTSAYCESIGKVLGNDGLCVEGLTSKIQDFISDNNILNKIIPDYSKNIAGDGICQAGEDPFFLNKDDCDILEPINLIKEDKMKDIFSISWVVRYLILSALILYAYYKYKK